MKRPLLVTSVLLGWLVLILGGCSGKLPDVLQGDWKKTSNSQYVLLFQGLGKEPPRLPTPPLHLGQASLPQVLEFLKAMPQAQVAQDTTEDGLYRYVEARFDGWTAIYFLGGPSGDTSRLSYVSCLASVAGDLSGQQSPLFHKVVAAFGDPTSVAKLGQDTQLSVWELPGFVITSRAIFDPWSGQTVMVLEYWQPGTWGQERPRF